MLRGADGTLENKYGAVLIKYIEKVFDMGFDGMCAPLLFTGPVGRQDSERTPSFPFGL